MHWGAWALSLCLLPCAAFSYQSLSSSSSGRREPLNPGRKYTTLERMKIRHLAAVHAQRMAFARQRVAPPASPGPYRDYRSVIHVHAEDSAHTGGTRQQVLQAAAAAAVDVVMLTDHNGPMQDTWRGKRGKVLFIAGSEDDHALRFPAIPEFPELRFLSHLDENPEMSPANAIGMEIYNRHSDSSDETTFNREFLQILDDPERWAALAGAFHRFPDEFFAAQQDYLSVFIHRWDLETARHPFTGIAANDAHQNQVYRGIAFDPYAINFRNVSTHILAEQLDEPSIRNALLHSRAYVSHDWLCDPAGFRFTATLNGKAHEMGSQVRPGARLQVQLPLSASIKVVHNGRLFASREASSWSGIVRAEGAYRIEAWLTVDGEQRPWIYSNPIYVAPEPH